MTHETQSTCTRSRTQLIAFMLFMVSLFLVFIRHAGNPPYTADSWSYFELSKTIFSDFYRLTTWRSYHSDIPYSASFPPLWPILIWLTNALTGFGPFSGFVLGHLVAILLAVTAEMFTFRHFNIPAIGITSVGWMLGDPGFYGEMITGASIPLHLLLISCLLLALTYRSNQIALYLALGAICGLMVLNRFDALTFVLALGAIAALCPTRRFLPIGIAAFALLMSGWIWYSLQKFGVALATDNRLVALSTRTGLHVVNWWPSWGPLLWDDPAGWLRKVAGNVLPLLRAIATSIPMQFLILGVTLCGAIAYRAVKDRTPNTFPDGSRLTSHLALCALPGVVLLALLATLPAYLATGYFDGRYFTAMRWLTIVISLYLISDMFNHGQGKRYSSAILLALMAVSLLGQTTNLYLKRDAFNFSVRPAREFYVSPLAHEIAKCSPKLDDGAIMFIDNPVAAAKFGALTGHSAAMMPRNIDELSPDQLKTFYDLFKIRYLTWETEEGLAVAQRIGGKAIDHCPVAWSR